MRNDPYSAVRSGYRRDRTMKEGHGFKGIKVKIADDSFSPYQD